MFFSFIITLVPPGIFTTPCSSSPVQYRSLICHFLSLLHPPQSALNIHLDSKWHLRPTIQMAETLMCWYIVRRLMKVIRWLSPCVIMHSSVRCHYLDRTHSYIEVCKVCVRMGKVKAQGSVISLSLGWCCPVLSYVSVCYCRQWWALTALCINGQCTRWLSMTDEILGWQEPTESQRRCWKQTNLIIFLCPDNNHLSSPWCVQADEKSGENQSS